MNLLMIGINHRTAPLEVREKFCIKKNEELTLLNQFRLDPAIYEAFLMSTCNRTEIYVAAESIETVREKLFELLFQLKKEHKIEDARKYFYSMQGEEVVSYLLRVCCGLDSLVLGEKQIIGQFRKHIDIARENKILGKQFNILSQVCIRAAKKSRNETEISYGGSSVSWAAIEKSESLLKSLRNKKVLIIGAGKMGELAARQLLSKGVDQLLIMNRTLETANELASKFNGETVPFCDIKEVLEEVDLCFCSAGAPFYIIEKILVEKVMSKREKDLLFIDVSVPRNIDPRIEEVSGVNLLDIDTLNTVVDDNFQRRLAAIHKVEAIIDQKYEEYHSKIEKNKERTSEKDFINKVR